MRVSLAAESSFTCEDFSTCAAGCAGSCAVTCRGDASCSCCVLTCPSGAPVSRNDGRVACGTC
ncbi:MAG: hypothetical protein Q8K32_02325 [Archangium sp.]|nr:hypothetical protein [Archangium sp.]